ncbi:hypothetical protein [Komagataeibacter saccharivorans]|uniref:hypothetical protein n=1 Tax=Komagataeibacter saccharivorans TaxID=265959 RepID=UPI003570ED2E
MTHSMTIGAKKIFGPVLSSFHSIRLERRHSDREMTRLTDWRIGMVQEHRSGR